MIHPTAFVHESARLGADVHVGAYAIIEAGVQIGAGSRLAEHAIVRAGCVVGERCDIDSFAVVGGAAQMRGGEPLSAPVELGDRCVLREGVTINRPSKADGCTRVASDCMLMANSHVGHDSEVGDGVTLANNVMLAGHVTVGAGTFVGGGAGIHQFVRIGSRVMVAGNASLSYDVPPFSLAAERNEIRGLNLVGLRRAKTPSEVVADLKRAYHAVYDGPGDFRKRAGDAIASGACGVEPAGREFLTFFTGGQRGFARPRSCGRG